MPSVGGHSKPRTQCGQRRRITWPRDDPTCPMSPYGSSKLMTEIMLRDAGVARGLDYVILRYFNVAGADPQARNFEVRSLPIPSSRIRGHGERLIEGPKMPTRRGAGPAILRESRYLQGLLDVDRHAAFGHWPAAIRHDWRYHVERGGDRGELLSAR
jgi:nucleoside-diphosphate-sugar epimerase